MYIQPSTEIDYSESQLSEMEIMRYKEHEDAVKQQEKNYRPKHSSYWAGGMMAV